MMQWVFNVRAAHGKAALVSGEREEVQLDEIPADRRAPIIKAYLKIALGARAHIPVSKDAPLEEFERMRRISLFFASRCDRPKRQILR